MSDLTTHKVQVYRTQKIGERIREIGKMYKLNESAITEAAHMFPGKMGMPKGT